MRFQRYFLRQIIGLGSDGRGKDPDEGSRSEVLESVQNQISGKVDRDRIIITLGKFAVGDVFDDNIYAHDPTTGFLNFAFDTLGSFDYAADSWGYTHGLAVETAMQVKAGRHEAPSAIRADLGAIFVSLELSRSTWLTTSLSLGAGEKMSKHSVPAGDICALLARFSELKQKAFARTAKSFRIIVIQEAGLNGFWIHRVLQKEGIESHVVQRPIGLTARRCCAGCWPISAANLGCVRWSKRRLPKMRTAAVPAASARC
jgi:hypothetical protein